MVVNLMANETPPPAAIDPKDFQIESLKKKLDEANALVKMLQADLKKVKSLPQVPEGDYASFKGVIYNIIGDYRADNTFAEVKRGNCFEGVTLLAIERQH